ncbi:hypothetical protein [Streptomyces sp. NPDC089919]|uniref:hypothetical protein n=1 Tax=Streptomyces sp. NPDC089919 TaxID=3155188 RepID=UPI003441B653
MTGRRQRGTAVARAALLALAAVVTLLHALFVAGPAPVGALDPDGCRARAAATADLAPDALCASSGARLSGSLGEGHVPGTGARAASTAHRATPSAPTLRQAVTAGSPTAVFDSRPARPAPARALALSSISAPSSVLRC